MVYTKSGFNICWEAWVSNLRPFFPFEKSGGCNWMRDDSVSCWFGIRTQKKLDLLLPTDGRESSLVVKNSLLLVRDWGTKKLSFLLQNDI
jgi:hypothetical protein